MVSSSHDIKVYRVGITDSAKRDLDKIFIFIKEASEFDYIAAGQVEMIEKTIMKLSIFPNGNPVFERLPEYRVMHAKKYNIIFEVDETKQEVRVIRVFHTRQNADGEFN